MVVVGRNDGVDVIVTTDEGAVEGVSDFVGVIVGSATVDATVDGAREII